MISVVICYTDKLLLSRLLNSLEVTTGVPFEVIAIDNSKDARGICAVYNEGAARAMYPLVCFVHEDVSFATEKWGERLAAHFADPQVGLIGVAGADVKSLVPSSWSVPSASPHIHIYQHYKYTDRPAEYVRRTNQSAQVISKRVSVVDGVLLATRKEVFQRCRFDEEGLPGFHGYDIDISLQVGRHYKLLVVFDVLIHHFSEGRPGREWLQSAVHISTKWRDVLPVSVELLTFDELRDQHWAAMQILLERMQILGCPLHERLSYLRRYSFNKFGNLRRFASMVKYILRTPTKETSRQKRAGLSNRKLTPLKAQ